MAHAMLQHQYGPCPVALQFSRATDLVQWPSLKLVSFRCSCNVTPSVCSAQPPASVARRAAASAARSSRRLSTTARTAAAQQEQPPVDYDEELQPEQLLAALSQTRTYNQLAAFVQSQPAAFLQSPLCVYALLHAVQLRDTLSDEQLGKGSLATEDKVLQQMEMVRGAPAAAQAADSQCRHCCSNQVLLPGLGMCGDGCVHVCITPDGRLVGAPLRFQAVYAACVTAAARVHAGSFGVACRQHAAAAVSAMLSAKVSHPCCCACAHLRVLPGCRLSHC
jgi:hypothetical protein